MKQLDENYVSRMKQLLGVEFDDYIDAINSQPVRAFRVNTDKISTEEFEKINVFGNKKIPYVDNGFYLNFDKVGNHPFHHAGMIYVQEPAAMAPAECVDISPDWKILDMCAAPGGKSTQLKNKLGKNGVLVSNEIVMNRCKILTGNIERLGLKNCITTCMDTARLANTFQNTFDLVMVDAPCSGEGMFRKDDTAVSEWSTDNVKMCALRQSDILENAVKCVKNGGYVIYATCTFSLEENEKVIDEFLANHSDFELIPVNKRVQENTEDGIFFDGCRNKNISYCRRFYPHKNAGEGQFMAVLKNISPYTEYNTSVKRNNKPDGIVKEFLDKTLKDYDEQSFYVKENKVFYFSADFDIQSLKAFSVGVMVGEIKKNYILPHHQFFSAFGKDFKNKIELSVDSKELSKYLHGEEFETDFCDGWAVVTVCGCSVGGVKISNGIAKNHYPKGLRIL
ncbi:MAG: RNA methyltransferase [Ruminococcaceae bacterium]|nr:RNA methyltransferase [Oscillospiraceae bacterium]